MLSCPTYHHALQSSLSNVCLISGYLPDHPTCICLHHSEPSFHIDCLHGVVASALAMPQTSVSFSVHYIHGSQGYLFKLLVSLNHPLIRIWWLSLSIRAKLTIYSLRLWPLIYLLLLWLSGLQLCFQLIFSRSSPQQGLWMCVIVSIAAVQSITLPQSLFPSSRSATTFSGRLFAGIVYKVIKSFVIYSRKAISPVLQDI